MSFFGFLKFFSSRNRQVVELKRSEVDYDALRSFWQAVEQGAEQGAEQELRQESGAESQAIETNEEAANDAVREVDSDDLGLVAIAQPETVVSDTHDIIDRFLEQENLRIVADVGSEPNDSEDLKIEQVSQDNSPISEQLAKIYLSQRLFDEAIDIYTKLSLQKTEKSVYFAELIEKAEKLKAEDEQSAKQQQQGAKHQKQQGAKQQKQNKQNKK